MHHISMKFERGRWQQIFECDIYSSIYTQPVISSSPPIISFQRFISSFDIFSSHSLPFCQSSTNNIFITMADGVNQTRGSNVDIVSARTSLFANAGCMLLICFAYICISSVTVFQTMSNTLKTLSFSLSSDCRMSFSFCEFDIHSRKFIDAF